MSYVELGLALMALAAPATYVDDGSSSMLPAHVTSLVGCWQGSGEVMDKPVRTQLNARSITQGAHVVIEADSQAVADAKDTYSAHILIGATASTDHRPAGLSSYFVDSFGGDASAMGTGHDTADGFEVTYRYGEIDFINRWTAGATTLSWAIVMKGADGTEQPFARYVFEPTACRG
jgi:hypothetical protein